MKQFIDKLIERLEERRQDANNWSDSEDDYFGGKEYAYENAIEIVNQLAEEHKDDIQTIDVSELLGESEQVKQTNADRIRAMSDEALAEFLEQIVSGNRNVIGINCGNSKCESWKCTECISMWLQSEAEEPHD